MPRRVKVEEMLAVDPRLLDTVHMRTPATLLISHGWTPADVRDLLTDWPDLNHKVARVLDAAVHVSGCHSWNYTALLPTTADLPTTVTRSWIRLLYTTVDSDRGRFISGSPALARMTADLPGGGGTNGVFDRQAAQVASVWTNLIGMPTLAVRIAAAGVPYGEAAEQQALHTPWTDQVMRSLATLGALRGQA